MKVSIITVVYNSVDTIVDTIQSVNSQDYPNIEHILVDGGSTDGTIDLIKLNSTKVARWISEPDKGIYDAMNKGFYLSTGEIIAFLNSDDVYFDNHTITKVVECFKMNTIDYVYGNLIVKNSKGEIVRFWKTEEVGEKVFAFNQIPHPALFVKKQILNKLDLPFDSNLKISADLKQQLLFIYKFKSKGYYLDETLTIMSNGGASTGSYKSYLLGWKETMDSFNSIFGSGGLLFTTKKVLSKFKGVKSFLLLTKK